MVQSLVIVDGDKISIINDGGNSKKSVFSCSQTIIKSGLTTVCSSIFQSNSIKTMQLQSS